MIQNTADFFNLIGEILGEWIVQEQHAAQISTFILNSWN
jgi:hypothetical protein